MLNICNFELKPAQNHNGRFFFVCSFLEMSSALSVAPGFENFDMQKTVIKERHDLTNNQKSDEQMHAHRFDKSLLTKKMRHAKAQHLLNQGTCLKNRNLPLLFLLVKSFAPNELQHFVVPFPFRSKGKHAARLNLHHQLLHLIM